MLDRKTNKSTIIAERKINEDIIHGGIYFEQNPAKSHGLKEKNTLKTLILYRTVHINIFKDY